MYKELRGAAKKGESAGGLLKARKIFKSSYGSPHVAFGQPLSLDECFSHIEPNWRKRSQAGDLSFVPAVIDYIAQENMERINAAAVVNPIGLVAMILLSSPQRAMAEDELLLQIDHFIAILRRLPYSPDVSLPEGTAQEILEQAARTAGLSRIDHPWVDYYRHGQRGGDADVLPEFGHACLGAAKLNRAVLSPQSNR